MALESTTDEIIEDLKEKTSTPEENRVLLYKILSMADLVKFAKYIPLPEDHERSMSDAVEFINKMI
jgi:hypothetical protein